MIWVHSVGSRFHPEGQGVDWDERILSRPGGRDVVVPESEADDINSDNEDEDGDGVDGKSGPGKSRQSMVML